MRKMRNGSGARIFKLVTVKVFVPGNRSYRRVRYSAGPGQGFNEDQIDNLLEQVARSITQKFPGQDYQLVELGPDTFNFVWRSEQAAKAASVAS
jgi:hypothetical protein